MFSAITNKTEKAAARQLSLTATADASPVLQTRTFFNTHQRCAKKIENGSGSQD